MMAISSSNLSPDNLFLGIDVGGTNVKFGLVDGDGVLQAKEMTATADLKTPQRVVEHAMKLADKYLMKQQALGISAIGMAVPGVLDTQEYRLREVVNLPGWLDQPLREILSDISGLPSAVVNDANSAAFAEHTLRKMGRKSLALVTLGTGIGCGVVINGNPHGGDHGCAGELGHIAVRFGAEAIECTCGSRGHLESYAGAQGVIRRLQLAIADAGPQSLPEGMSGSDISPKQIADAAEAGSQPCRQIIRETAQYVGHAVGMLGQVIDPQVVLIGGAMNFGGPGTAMGDEFLQGVRDTVRETTLVQVGGNMIIDFATLGNDAGLLGAAMVAIQGCQRD